MIYTSAHSGSDNVAGAVTPVLQRRKLRSRGTRIRASGHTEMTAGGDAQTPPLVTRTPTGGAVALCGEPPGPPAGNTVSQAVHSPGTEHRVSSDCTVLLGNAAKATDKPDTSRAYVCRSVGLGGETQRRGQKFFSVNRTDNVVYLASYNACNYNPLRVQNTACCGNGSRTTLKGSAGLSFRKHRCYPLAHRDEYRSARGPELKGSSASAHLPPQHRKPAPACWTGSGGRGRRRGKPHQEQPFTEHVLRAGPRSKHCPYVSLCTGNLM